VLEFRPPPKLAGCDLLGNLLQPACERPQLLLREQPDFLQHCRVGNRPANVSLPEPPIKRDRFAELRDLRSRIRREPPAARDHRTIFSLLQSGSNLRARQPKVTREARRMVRDTFRLGSDL